MSQALRLVVVTFAVMSAVACGAAPVRTLPNGAPIAVMDEACAESIQPLYDALRDIDSRLSVAVDQLDYSARLLAARGLYEAAISEDALLREGACYDTRVKLRRVGSEYTKAHNAWVECIADTRCDDDDVRPALERHWAQAKALLDEAAFAFP